MEDLLFFCAELFVALNRGHDLVLIIGIDEFDKGTFFGMPRDEGFAFDRFFTDVEAEIFFARLWIGAVTEKAFIRQNRADVTTVTDL